MLIETSQAQRTLAGEFELADIGLHTGRVARLRCRPAPPNSGVTFHRVDIGPNALIPARVDQLAGEEAQQRRTTLGSKASGFVSTCEHLLSAFSGHGIDNALVEIDGEETPFFDGSSLLFAQKIAAVGAAEQDAPRWALALREPVVFERGLTEIVAVPADRFGATVFVDFGPRRGEPQAFRYMEGETGYDAEVAPARTFCFEEEIEALRKAGLIKGGSLENAVVIGEGGCLNEGGLRFPDELARHKVLDLLGDLMLLGRRLRAHVTASRAGHASHLAFARLLLDRAGPPPSSSAAPAAAPFPSIR
jgi:UDP-3-O-acyl N-acetylglucosamine deacetylase